MAAIIGGSWRLELHQRSRLLSFFLFVSLFLPVTVEAFTARIHGCLTMSSLNRPKASGGSSDSRRGGTRSSFSTANAKPSSWQRPRSSSSPPSTYPIPEKSPFPWKAAQSPPPTPTRLTPKSSLPPAVDLGARDQIYEPSLLPPRKKPTTLLISDRKRGLWVFEQPFILGVVDVKNRMSVLRLSDGGFALYSPLAATPECIDMLKSLVKSEKLSLSSAWFMVPSSFPEHHESLVTWREVFPEARVVSVHPRINVISEFLLEGPSTDAPSQLPLPLRKDLDVAVYETPLLREMVLTHKPSKTLFVADSGFYINEEYSNSLTRGITQLQGIYDRFVTPPFFRLGMNKKEGKRLYERVKDWGFDKIVTCHAALVEEGKGKEAFLEGYRHLA